MPMAASCATRWLGFCPPDSSPSLLHHASTVFIALRSTSSAARTVASQRRDTHARFPHYFRGTNRSTCRFTSIGNLSIFPTLKQNHGHFRPVTDKNIELRQYGNRGQRAWSLRVSGQYQAGQPAAVMGGGAMTRFGAALTLHNNQYYADLPANILEIRAGITTGSGGARAQTKYRSLDPQWGNVAIYPRSGDLIHPRAAERMRSERGHKYNCGGGYPQKPRMFFLHVCWRKWRAKCPDKELLHRGGVKRRQAWDACMLFAISCSRVLTSSRPSGGCSA